MKQERYRATKKSPTAIELHRELNALKKTQVPWMYDVSKCAPQEALAPLLGILDQTASGSPGVPLAVTLLRVAENRTMLQECWDYLEGLRVVLMDMPVCSRVEVCAEAIIGSAPGAIVGRIERGIQGQAVSDVCPVGPVDLLIMATHGRGGVGRLILGSVADYVLPRAEVPVFLVHPIYLDF